MVNIAICYFGMPRSLRKVYNTHQIKLFNILKNNNNRIQKNYFLFYKYKEKIWQNARG